MSERLRWRSGFVAASALCVPMVAGAQQQIPHPNTPVGQVVILPMSAAESAPPTPPRSSPRSGADRASAPREGGRESDRERARDTVTTRPSTPPIQSTGEPKLRRRRPGE